MTFPPARFKQFLADAPIRNKFILIIFMFCVGTVINFTMSVLGMHYLDACRAYVGAESLWSKAQKQAVLRLGHYGASHDEKDFVAFQSLLSIPLGDRQARLELEKPQPDLNVVSNGFLRGGNHPKDIPGMAHLFRRFRRVYYMDQAIHIWGQADEYILRLQKLGDDIHAEMNSRRPSLRRLQLLLNQVHEIDAKLTPLENAFSSTLGQGARWINRTTIVVKLAVSSSMLLASIAVAVMIIRQLCGEIDHLRKGAARVASGDFDVNLGTGSKDEIGQLSLSFQQMAAQREIAEATLVKQGKDLEQANHELEAFSYSVSHDLRAPLRSIDGFSKELMRNCLDKLDARSQSDFQRICAATQRMAQLIDDLLSLSRLTRTEIKWEAVDLEALVREIISELELADASRKAKWAVHSPALVNGDARLLRIVLENLLQNAWKFTQQSVSPEIVFGVSSIGDQRTFFVKDNGVGFDMAYVHKLFVPFQRLHDMKEFPGTGIGLALVQRIIRRHGGEIWAEAEENHGAIFYFRLPKVNALVTGGLR